jgi:hypothetical protein
VDLRLYLRVLWRFRLLVAAGLLIALTLAFFSVMRVGPDGIEYRQSQLWGANMRLLVTQKGFPEGRLYAQPPSESGEIVDQAAALGIPIADPGRFNALAILYAELASSDPVRQLMLRDGPVLGKVVAQAMRDEQSGTPLPLIDLTAVSNTPQGAMGLAVRSAEALDTFITAQQKANDVPATDRVVIETIVRPRGATVFQPRSKTMAIVVFLAVMLATVGLAFLLENMRPRQREAAATVQPPLLGSEQRRTA